MRWGRCQKLTHLLLSNQTSVKFLSHLYSVKNNGVLCRALACLEHRFQTIDPFQFGTLLVLAMPLFQWSMSGHARRTLDSGKSVRTLFVDFTKAFDRVDHTLLLNKMITLGAPPLLVEWMFSFLKGRYHRVKIQGYSSDWIQRWNASGYLVRSFIFHCHDWWFEDRLFNSWICRWRHSNRNITIYNNAKYHAEFLRWATFMGIHQLHVKTKELTLGHVTRSPLASLAVEGNQIDRVPVLSC